MESLRTRIAPPPAGEVDGAVVPDDRLLLDTEQSWLAFNERVLAQASERALPPYERLKFLAIVSSNLDEFFMARVAELERSVRQGLAERAEDGLTPTERRTRIASRVHSMIERQQRLLHTELVPALAREGVALVAPEDFTPEQAAAARTFFRTRIRPALAPKVIASGHRFPLLRRRTLYLAFVLRRAAPSDAPGPETFAFVRLPPKLPRLIPLPATEGRACVLLERLVAAHAAELFPNDAVENEETAVFRVLRRWALDVDGRRSEDLRAAVAVRLRRSHRGAAVRLELSANASPGLEERLRRALSLEPVDVHRIPGVLQLPDLLALADADARAHLHLAPHTPVVPVALQRAESLFPTLAARDVLLHHPYESIEPVVRFVEQAAADPDVVAIQQTLYRTNRRSPFVRALEQAAANGKQVTAVVELRARFDEANNVAWSRRLERSGVRVVHRVDPFPDHKTHCKLTLVTRREGDELRRYLHLGTGNYNTTTAGLYTDLSLLTAREALVDDAAALFQLLTDERAPTSLQQLVAAPFGLRERVIALVDREAARARRGEAARIVAQMNSLIDPEVIRALYEASNAGVEIDLVVRGICCLRPGVPGLSERIRVTSIVDRFLEHTRVFAFGAGERTEVFVSSADWRPRNFLDRIEVMCPIEDPALKARLVDEVLALCLADNAQAWRLRGDGDYVKVDPAGAPLLRAQQSLAERARRGTEPPLPPDVQRVA